MKSITQAFLLAIGTAFAMTACGSTPASLETPAVLDKTLSVSLLKDPSLDGKAIFRGVAFGEQTLGQVLPEVWRGGVVLNGQGRRAALHGIDGVHRHQMEGGTVVSGERQCGCRVGETGGSRDQNSVPVPLQTQHR